MLDFYYVLLGKKKFQWNKDIPFVIEYHFGRVTIFAC